MTGWLVAVLVLVIITQAFFYRKLRKQLHQQKIKNIQLSSEFMDLEKELAEVKTRRKRLLAAATQALIIVEKDFTISNANKVARRLFGSKPTTETTFMAWTRNHQLQELVEMTLQGEKIPPIYVHLGDRILEAQARSIKRNKEVVAAAVAIHNVTRVQRLSRALREFVTNISHELRTPLASIQLLTETLRNGALDDKEMAPQLIDKLALQTETLSQLAQELLDLSMIESRKAPLRMGPHSLQTIVNKQRERLLPQTERKKLSLKNDITEDITVLVDETMMSRVFGNLIHNAIKFTEVGGIIISAQRPNGTALVENDGDEGEWVTISIADTGVGIPPEELPRIFERFYKIDRVRRKATGTGLGLAISRHIVEAHGGRIWAESDGHSGTTFYFTLPVEET